MSEHVTIDVIHLSFLVPVTLPEAESQAIGRALRSQRFLREVQKSLRTVVKASRRLERLRITLAF